MSSNKHSYICNKCGETSMFSKTPSYCPFCGSNDFKRNNEKAKRHAEEIINEMTALIPDIEKAWQAYVDLYVEFENKRRTLTSYALRGIIDKDMIPTIEKKRLIDALKDYRSQNKFKK